MNTLTLDYIKTAVTVATFLVSQGLSATVGNVRSYFRREPSPLAKTFEQPQEVAFIGRLVIDRDLLRELNRDVEDSVSKYVECLRVATIPQERDACDRRAERRVCETLNRIKDRNQGSLPTDYLKDQWQSYRCIDI